jgi:hypothetical protein
MLSAPHPFIERQDTLGIDSVEVLLPESVARCLRLLPRIALRVNAVRTDLPPQAALRCIE